MFSDAFTTLTTVGSVTVKVFMCNHADSTSSGQHFGGLDRIIVIIIIF